MDELRIAIKMLIERQGLLSDSNSFNLRAISNSKMIYHFEATNDMSDIENYLIYDTTHNINIDDYYMFEEFLSSHNSLTNIFFVPVIIFNNWDAETKFYKYIFKCLKNARQRKDLKHLFDSKISIYTELNDRISICVSEEINYLEYTHNDNSYNFNKKGYIYNISFSELKKLFNVTGNDLFKKNIRKGITNNKTIDNIKNEFKQYLCVCIYYELKSKYEKEQLQKALGINDDILVKNSPENFWFCHNEITIFSFDENEFERVGNTILLNPKKVSVINGAQTLTSFFDCLNKIQEEFNIMFQDMDIDEIDCKSLLKEATNKIFLKTIFIHGSEEEVSNITVGLNTQVPVLSEHIIADSQTAKELNAVLRNGNIEIVKEGYNSVYNQGYDVLDFAKKYLLCKNKPGKSKNLRKDELDSILQDALNDFKSQKIIMLEKMNKISDIDEWWKNYKKKRDELYENTKDIVFCKYGKNYFSSYVLNENKLNDDYFLSFENFIRDMSKLSDKLFTSNDFKKDDLFKLYISNKKKEYLKNNNPKIINCENLLCYLSENIKSQYSISAVISKYLSENSIELDNFRIVNRISNKCCEAFPFPSSVFSEIYHTNTDYEGKYISFEDSKFKKFIEKHLSLFVLDNISEGNGEKKLINVFFIEKFTFIEYMEDARNVFEKTINAFEKGDESLFPKVSDKLNFHVRTKAINARDTFEFSNGNDITKRTFWANKELLNKLIEQHLNESDY